MSLRSLTIVLIALAFSSVAVASMPAGSSCGSSCNQRVTGEAVVCDGGVQPAPAATWWANSAIGNFCRSVVRDTKRNNCWPEPFPKADREAVRMPFALMVANGVRRENTLGDHHFDPETGKLNRAGELKIRSILLEGLPQNRLLSVYRAERASETAARVEVVQQYAAQTVRDGVMPQIIETDIPAPGWPAQFVERVDGKFEASMPDPRLPKLQTADQQSQQ
jgi:hypothetical protein